MLKLVKAIDLRCRPIMQIHYVFDSDQCKILIFSHITYSRCQKYESSPIFVKKLNIRLYPEFLSNQIRTFGAQIRSLGTQTCTLCSTIASNIFALTFLPHLLATLVNLVLYIHGH